MLGPDDEQEIDDSVKCCPDCERPNQFGERCNECERERYALEMREIGSCDDSPSLPEPWWEQR